MSISERDVEIIAKKVIDLATQWSFRGSFTTAAEVKEQNDHTFGKAVEIIRDELAKAGIITKTNSNK